MSFILSERLWSPTIMQPDRTKSLRQTRPLSFMTVIQLLLLTLTLTCASRLVSGDIYTDSDYTYRIDQTLTPPPSNLQWTNSNASAADDYDFDLIALPSDWFFPFYNQLVPGLLIDPNGGVHFHHSIFGFYHLGECCAPAGCTFTASNCDFNSQYLDMIAMFLTDLNPGNITGGVNNAITYSFTQPGSFFLRYQNVPLFLLTSYDYQIYPRESFSVELRSTGVIVTQYEDVFDPRFIPDSGGPDQRGWMVGLRPPLTFNSEQTLHGDEYNTTLPGTYPPRSQITTGTTITYWPFSSVACNSPAIGDGSTLYVTNVYLNGFGTGLQNFNFSCVFNGGTDPNYPTVLGWYNVTSNSVFCSMAFPFTPVSTPVPLQLALSESSTTGLLPLTPMTYTLYPASSPVIARYKSLASLSGGNDRRVCYECARMLPDLCLAGNTISQGLCNTPQIGASATTTSTVILAPGYNVTQRLTTGGVSQIYCVWSNPSSLANDASNPNNLNPYLNNVLWTNATYYSNVSWLVCTPPATFPIGTQFNLTIAEDNFVLGGGVGIIGGGIGSAGPSPLGMDAPTTFVWNQQQNNQHLTMLYTIINEGTDANWMAYAADDYFNDFLFAPGMNLTNLANEYAALNLDRYCSDCAVKLSSTLLSSSFGTASSIATGFCLDPSPASLNISICVSPNFGDANGDASAEFNVFFNNYPAHIRRELFNLSCTVSNYYVLNYSTWVNTSVQIPTVVFTNVTTLQCDNTTHVCTNVTTTTNSTVLVSGYQLILNSDIEYVPVNNYLVPMTYDSVRHLYSCQAPPESFFDWTTVTATYPNITQGSILISVAENNRPIAVAQPAVFTYLLSSDPILTNYTAARTAVPALPPWTYCFKCNSGFKTVLPKPIPDFSILSDGSSYCYSLTFPFVLQYYPLCNSPGVSGMLSTDNTTIEIYSNAIYPIATRASLTQIYCRFTTPPQYNVTFNSTTNVTTSILLNHTDPYVWVPVSAYNLNYGFIVCQPPLFSVFNSANLSVTLAEYQDVLPLSPFLHTYVAETDPRLTLYRSNFANSTVSVNSGGNEIALAGSSAFSSQQFCNDCHASTVGNVPNFTPYSPVGVAGLCYLDCATVWNGGAVYDDCGVCSRGTTTHVYNQALDCLSTCFGPFTVTVGPKPGGGTFPYCRCQNDPACFNITAQPLIGVSKNLPIPGQPAYLPINDASVNSQQYLIKSFVIPLSHSNATTGLAPNSSFIDPTLYSGPYNLVNDPSTTYAADPNFDSSTPWIRIPSSTWLNYSAPDPYSIPISFKFPFFEAKYTIAYISSSGAIMFAPLGSYVRSCLQLPASVDARIKNTGLLYSLAEKTDFTSNTCANFPMIMPYFTNLDPSQPTLKATNQAVLAVIEQMATATNATVSYAYGNSSTVASNPQPAQSGAYLSIKFENVPYNSVAFNPYAANTGQSVTPPLYSFQVTLYETGKISMKFYNVTDPTSSGHGFNTTTTFSHALVGLIDRPMPTSVLTQSSPLAAYVTQLQLAQSKVLDVEGAIAMTRQSDWFINSTTPIGVFPPRSTIVSGTHQIYCPFAINACIYPRVGPTTGGTNISVTLWNLGVDSGCINNLLSLQCVFGDYLPLSPATYEPISKTLTCMSPPGPALTTVPVFLMEGNTTLITTNKLFWSWFNFGDARLEVESYDAVTNITQVMHITGNNDPDVNNTLTATSFRQNFCNTCGPFNPDYCPFDCFGTYFGTAFVDDCGNCTAGATGLLPNFAQDCAGVCFGSSQNVTGASGQAQCICSGVANAACQVAALPTMKPPATLNKQYIYHLNPSLVPNTSSLTSAPAWDASGWPSSTITVDPPAEPFELDLPFLFQYYQQSLRTIYVSSYGAIFFEDPTAKTGDNSCLVDGLAEMFSNTSRTSVCPYQLIAASVTTFDLTNPASKLHAYASIESNGLQSVTIIWSKFFEMGNSSSEHTFQIQLLEGGHFTASYLNVHDPNADARLAAELLANGTTPVVSNNPATIFQATFDVPAPPSYATTAPYWLVGITENWYTTSGIYNPTAVTTNLAREISYPFPYQQKHLVATTEQKQYISTTITPTGTFPNRLQIKAGTQYQYCALGVEFCMTPTWGAVEGGALLRFFGSDWGCQSNGTALINCCASQLQFSCVFGQTLVIPGVFNPTSLAVECVTPPGLLDTSVQVYLAENGRRIGSSTNFVFQYNTTQFDLNNNVANSSLYYGSESFACESCASFIPALLQTSNVGFCYHDCYSTFRGTATLDTCGVCSGGLTNHVAESDRDCHGVCFGPFVVRNVTEDGDYTRENSPVCVCEVGNCGYFPAADGPQEASTVIRMHSYRYFLISMIIGGVILFAIHALLARIFGWRSPFNDLGVIGGQGGGGGGAALGGPAVLLDGQGNVLVNVVLLPPGQQVPPLPPGSGLSARRSSAAAAGGPGPRAVDFLLGVAGGLEMTDRQRAREERRRERRAARRARERAAQAASGGGGGASSSTHAPESAAPSNAALAALEDD